MAWMLKRVEPPEYHWKDSDLRDSLRCLEFFDGKVETHDGEPLSDIEWEALVAEDFDPPPKGYPNNLGDDLYLVFSGDRWVKTLVEGIRNAESTGSESAWKAGENSGRSYWLYNGKWYWENDGLSDIEIKAIIDQRERRMRAKIAIDVASGTEAASPGATPRDPIPDDVKIFIWRRDEGKCVQCGSRANLEFDHVIPLVMGGANTARNLQLLCELCNRRKGGSLV